MDDEGTMVGFRQLQVPASFRLPMLREVDEEEFAAMARAGFAVNELRFRQFEPGMLLMNSIHLQASGSVMATLTPLLQPAGDHIRRADFAELFGPVQ